MTIRRAFLAMGCLLAVAGQVVALQPAGGQSEFVPVNELPAAEQLAAGPLLVAAYAFVWVALLLYVWSIWRRLGKVEADLQALQRRSGTRSSDR